MRRVDADLVFRPRPQPHIGAGLGAVAVQHVGPELPDQADDLRPDHEVGKTRLAADGDAMNAELQPRLDFRQRRRGAFSAVMLSEMMPT